MTMRLALHTWGSPDAGKTALLIHGVMSSYSTDHVIYRDDRQGFLTSLEGWS
jgi:hypothetical protein